MATSPSPSHPNTITYSTVITNNNNVAIFDKEMLPTSGTTFVQADPSNFRALVQKLTGASTTRDSSNHKLPVTYSNREAKGHRIPPFKLQERRQSRKNLKINLQIVPGVELHPYSWSTDHVTSSSAVQNRMLKSNNNDGFWEFNDGSRDEMGMAKASPVSTLDFMVAHSRMISPRKAMSREELEEKGIAEKGYYLHPTPPGCRAPQLLPLFPLHHSSST